jgi:hypothetical protein
LPLPLDPLPLESREPLPVVHDVLRAVVGDGSGRERDERRAVTAHDLVDRRAVALTSQSDQP